MNPDPIHLVQLRVQPARAAAANLFSGCLFELAADTRAPFRRDLHIQRAMLMSTLDLVAGGRFGSRATMAVKVGNMAPQVMPAP